VIWRVQDANNYYIARANALENNVTIYHTIKGKRVAFKNINTKVTSGVWHTLRVDFKGNKFTVTFDGNKVIEATDESFANAGKVGVWTKADSVTLFDDFTYGANRCGTAHTCSRHRKKSCVKRLHSCNSRTDSDLASCRPTSSRIVVVYVSEDQVFSEPILKTSSAKRASR